MRWAWSKIVCWRSIGSAVRSKKSSRWSTAWAGLEQDFGAVEKEFWAAEQDFLGLDQDATSLEQGLFQTEHDAAGLEQEFFGLEQALARMEQHFFAAEQAACVSWCRPSASTAAPRLRGGRFGAKAGVLVVLRVLRSGRGPTWHHLCGCWRWRRLRGRGWVTRPLEAVKCVLL